MTNTNAAHLERMLEHAHREITARVLEVIDAALSAASHRMAEMVATLETRLAALEARVAAAEHREARRQ